MKKRILSFVLALIMALSFSLTTFAGPGGGGLPPADGPLRGNSRIIEPDYPDYPNEPNEEYQP